jgi:cytochrome c oxidase subunit 1
MSEASTAHAHAEHHKQGFVASYVVSVDPKLIGRRFLFSSLVMVGVGGLVAMRVRWQLG